MYMYNKVKKSLKKKYLYSITFLQNWIKIKMIVDNEKKWIQLHPFPMNFMLNCKIQIILSLIISFHSPLFYLLITYTNISVKKKSPIQT